MKTFEEFRDRFLLNWFSRFLKRPNSGIFWNALTEEVRDHCMNANGVPVEVRTTLMSKPWSVVIRELPQLTLINLGSSLALLEVTTVLREIREKRKQKSKA